MFWCYGRINIFLLGMQEEIALKGIKSLYVSNANIFRVWRKFFIIFTDTFF